MRLVKATATQPHPPRHATNRTELYAGELQGTVVRTEGAADFVNGKYQEVLHTQRDVDGRLVHLASSAQLAAIGLFGRAEAIVNDFFGGGLVTVDELAIQRESIGNRPFVDHALEFTSTVNGVRQDRLSIFDDDPAADNGVAYSQVTHGIAGLNYEVVDFLFGNRAPAFIIEAGFKDESDTRFASFRSDVEPLMRELAHEAGVDIVFALTPSTNGQQIEE